MGYFHLKIILEEKVVRLIKDNFIKMQFKQDCKFYQMILENTKHKLLAYVTQRSGLYMVQML